MSVDAAIVFFARPTTLIGAGEFPTTPLDVSGFTGVQFQAWRGVFESSGPPTPTMTLYLEESLDAKTWVLGASQPEGVVLEANDDLFFSYTFRLRWFRIRVVTEGESMATMWVEGLLRGGGSGIWNKPPAGRGATGAVMAPTMAGGASPLSRNRAAILRQQAFMGMFSPGAPDVGSQGSPTIAPWVTPYNPSADPTVGELLDAVNNSGKAPDGTVPPGSGG